MGENVNGSVTQPENVGGNQVIQDKEPDNAVHNQEHNEPGLIKKNRELLAELKKHKDELKSLKEKELKEKEQWKDLYESEKKAREESESRINEIQAKIKESAKTAAVRSELLKRGFNQQYLDIVDRLVDTSSLTYDDETRTVGGVEIAAKAIQEKYAPFFGGAKTNVNHDAPDGTKPITLEDWRKMSMEDQVKYKPELEKALGINRTK
jgi:hypothetical protein